MGIIRIEARDFKAFRQQILSMYQLLELLYGDRLHFEMPAAEDGRHANELPRGKFFGEVALINGVEFVVVGKIGARDLHIDQIVHRETGLTEERLVGSHEVDDLVLDLVGRFASLRIKPDIPGNIQRIPYQNGVAEGGLR